MPESVCFFNIKVTRIRYTTKMISSSCSCFCSRCCCCCLLLLQIMTVKITHYTGLHSYRHTNIHTYIYIFFKTCSSRFLQSYSSYSICVPYLVIVLVVVLISFVYFTGTTVRIHATLIFHTYHSVHTIIELNCFAIWLCDFVNWLLFLVFFFISVYNCCLTPTERYPEKWGHTNFLVDFGKN